MSNELFKMIDNLDIFKFPIKLTFDNQSQTKTYSGKVWTLIILVYIIYSFILSDYMQKTNPKTLNQDIKTPVRSYMNFTKSDLQFVIGITDDSNVFHVDPTIFQIIIYQSYENLTTGDRIDNYLTKKFCEPSDFPDPTTFDTLGLQK